MKKFIVGLVAVFIGSSAFSQEIKVITTSFGLCQYMEKNGEYIDLVKPGVMRTGGYSSPIPFGIYIIEIEGQKYIVNAAGGIVKLEPKLNDK